MLHPTWLETRLPPMAVYFVGLLALATALFSLTFNFFQLYLVCYPMASSRCPGGGRTPGWP